MDKLELVSGWSGGGFSHPIYTVTAELVTLNYSVSVKLLDSKFLEIMLHILKRPDAWYILFSDGFRVCFSYMVKTGISKCY